MSRESFVGETHAILLAFNEPTHLYGGMLETENVADREVDSTTFR